jgi:hypothetical protein
MQYPGKPRTHREPAYQRAWMRTTEHPCPVPGLKGDCWIFEGATLKGYGQIHSQGKTAYSHHVGFEYLRGARDPALELDHLCRTPRCWNPWHLEQVDHPENVRRGPGNGYREKTHCPAGHEYNEENTYRPPGRTGRECRTCRREDSLRRYYVRKAKK